MLLLEQTHMENTLNIQTLTHQQPHQFIHLHTQHLTPLHMVPMLLLIISQRHQELKQFITPQLKPQAVKHTPKSAQSHQMDQLQSIPKKVNKSQHQEVDQLLLNM